MFPASHRVRYDLGVSFTGKVYFIHYFRMYLQSPGLWFISLTKVCQQAPEGLAERLILEAPILLPLGQLCSITDTRLRHRFHQKKASHWLAKFENHGAMAKVNTAQLDLQTHLVLLCMFLSFQLISQAFKYQIYKHPNFPFLLKKQDLVIKGPRL